MAKPRHIAIIMDGNGRWAQARNRPRTLGHRAGARAVNACIDTCLEDGIEVLTLCRDQKLPINVFSIFKPHALRRVVLGEDEGTMVHV